MKKSRLFLSVAFFMAAMSFVAITMTSCNQDDDDDDGTTVAGRQQ